MAFSDFLYIKKYDIGEMIVVPMMAPEPFAVGRIIESTDSGDLTLRWYGNATNSPFQPFRPGWIDEEGHR